MDILKEDILSSLPEDLVSKAQVMSKVYEYLYCLENILRLFIENHPNRQQIHIPVNLQRNVANRREDEVKHKWIALRGNSELFYLDFGDLKSVISNNWDFFKSDFPSLIWIQGKLDDLVRCRNLVAHNSYVDIIELEVIRTNFNAITRQLGYKQNAYKELQETNEQQFVSGLNRSVVFTHLQAANGIDYKLNYPRDVLVKPLFLRTVFIQFGIFFQVIFEKGGTTIYPRFDIGWNKEEGMGFKNSVLFQIGQYDIDSDGIEEVFICLQDNTLGDNGVQINVYKYYPPAFKTHAGRQENWELLGSFCGPVILGEPKAIINQNAITISRNLHGFYYEWTFTRGRFLKTGNM